MQQSQTLTTVYDSDGTVASESDTGAQGTVSYSYDILGKKTRHQVALPTGGNNVSATVAMTYDASGDMTSTNETGMVYNYAYDAANQLTQTYPATGSCTATGNPAANSGCVKFTYDSNGAETARIFPGGARQDTARDDSGRESRITAKNSSSAVTFDVGYSYTPT